MKDRGSMKNRFSERRKLLSVREHAEDLASELEKALADEAELRKVLNGQHPADLADAMMFMSKPDELTLFKHLTTLEAAEVLDEVHKDTRVRLLKDADPQWLVDVLEDLPSDEAVNVL